MNKFSSYYKIIDKENTDAELEILHKMNHLLPVQVRDVKNDLCKVMVLVIPLWPNQLVYSRTGRRIVDIGYKPITKETVQDYW